MKGILAAFKFLAGGGRFRQDQRSTELSAALYFPLVGLVIGLGLVLLNRFLEPRLESELLAVVLIAIMILATQAVHLDGTLKTFAALAPETAAGGADRPVGIYGMLAVLLIVFLHGAAPAVDESVAGVVLNVKGWHLLITTIATLALAGYLLGRPALWISLSLSLLALLSRSYLRWRCGGYRYDHLGALIELSEALRFV